MNERDCPVCGTAEQLVFASAISPPVLGQYKTAWYCMRCKSAGNSIANWVYQGGASAVFDHHELVVIRANPIGPDF